MAIAFDANLGNVTNSASLTTSAAAASGSRVLMFVWWYGTQTCTGASGGGLTWVDDHESVITIDGGSNLCILSADAPSGLASSTSLTPSFSATPAFGPGIAAASFTGLATGAAGYVDDTSTAVEDFNASWATANLVTTLADTVLIGFSLGPGSSGNTAAGSNTEIHDWLTEGSNRAATEYRIVASASTYTVTGTWGAGMSFQANIGIAYEADAGGPPPEGPKLRISRPTRMFRR